MLLLPDFPISQVNSPCFSPRPHPLTLRSPSAGLFTYSDETRCHWFRPGGGPPERDPQYSLAGLILGLAIYNSVTLDVRLPAVVYRKLAGRRGALEDLDQLSPVRGVAGAGRTI